VNFRCPRCGKQVSNPVWLMWRGRLVRVGQDCADAIRREKSEPVRLCRHGRDWLACDECDRNYRDQHNT
jgi:uncharacterized C2H2 Zn-finger protein